MRNIYKILPDSLEGDHRICLATLVAKKGSVPQEPGSSAIYSDKERLAGTLGGGILEGDAEKKAIESIRTGRYRLYEFQLKADIDDQEGALCGGTAKVLLDPEPGIHMDCYRQMSASLEGGRSGLMITIIRDRAEKPIGRSWKEWDELDPDGIPGDWKGISEAISKCREKGACISLENEEADLIFLEPLFPRSKLYIAGAGHIGKALAHQAKRLDFEVTVIDDRPEFANRENIPDADHIQVKNIGEAVSEIPKTADTYMVIVTRGHKDDTNALKACIRDDLPYIGMIGSRRKIRTLKEKFIEEGWSSREEFERVHAPIGIEIGSVSVEEIALSISAQLVQVRASGRKGRKREYLTTLILAAGESLRMGRPKMLLPFGDSTIIQTITGNAIHSVSDHIRVVIGAHAEDIRDAISGLNAEIVLNSDFREGMLSSVQAGLRSLPKECTAVMILLGDQPMLPADLMDRTMEAYKLSEKDILIATVNGQRGHPMIFNVKYVPEILSYGPGGSLRDLPARHPGDVEELETGNPEILRDIDTPQDYENELKS